MSFRLNFSFLFIILLALALVQPGEGNTNYNLEPEYIAPSLDTVIAGNTIYEDQNLSLDESIFVSDASANLTIINSILTFTNTSLTNGIEISNGGKLTVIDSKIIFSGIDHAVFGTGFGELTYDNATLSSVNADGTHLEGDFQISINNSVFQDTGDDGLHIELNSIPFLVENTVFLNNGDDGFDLLNVDNAELRNSRIEGVKGDAVKVVESGNITLRNILLDGTGATAIDDNRGMDLENTENIIVENAVVKNFPSDGVKAVRTPFFAKNVTVQNVGDEGFEFENTISEFPVHLDEIDITNANGGDSIKIEFVEGHIFINNTNVVNSGDDGIQITQGNTTAVIENTLVTGSFEDGFELDGSVWLIMNNVSSLANNENGIKFKTIGDVTMLNCDISNNFFNGISSGNAQSLTITESAINANAEGGIVIHNSNEFVLEQSEISNNQKLNVLSNGVSIGGIANFIVSENQIDANSGSGIQVDQSNGTIITNTVTNNQMDGIALAGGSQVDVVQNTISNNGRYGLSIVNGSNGLIINNIFESNADYGVYVDSVVPVNVSSNYWGSDSGPIWQAKGKGQRDGVFGNVIIEDIIDSNGNHKSFTPPSELNFETLFFIAMGILVALGIVGVIVYQVKIISWKKNTEPVAMIYINHIGLPIMEYHFVKGTMDPALISGFLSAVSSFGSEIYSREDKTSKESKKTREIQSKENVIILYPIDKSMLTLIVSDSNPAIRKTLRDFGDEFVQIVSTENGKDMDEKASNFNIAEFEKLVEKRFNDFKKNVNS